MKSEEKEYLMLVKESNGKSREQAVKEINNIKNSQLRFKELEKEILNLKKQLLSKEKTIESLRNDNFKLIGNNIV